MSCDRWQRCLDAGAGKGAEAGARRSSMAGLQEKASNAQTIQNDVEEERGGVTGRELVGESALSFWPPWSPSPTHTKLLASAVESRTWLGKGGKVHQAGSASLHRTRNYPEPLPK